jgi:Ca2+-transporting ATPase
VVRWGRSVYANIQKFIQFQLTVNVAALIINVVAAISSGNVPLNAVQVCQNIINYISWNHISWNHCQIDFF